MVTTSSSLGYDAVPPQQPEPTQQPTHSVADHIPVSIVDETENEDGSLDITLKMDYATLVHFARIGIEKVITDEANRIIADNGSVL